jgi:serine/threonine protein kinase
MKYGDTYFITMEYVEGEDLNTRLGLYQQEGRNFALEEVLAVARDVCAAVDYAHSLKVLHLDLKPSNIVAMTAGGYKVMDFGIARAARESMTRVSRAAGYTGGYAAPEQILGKPVDRRTDVYGLAATFYDLLAGRVPCPTDYATVNVPPKPIPGVSERVNGALRRALAKDPGERFPTAATLSGALRGEKPPATAEAGKAGILGKAVAPEVKATASAGMTTPPVPSVALTHPRKKTNAPSPAWPFYVLSFVVPIAGIIVGAIYVSKPNEDCKEFGKKCLITAVGTYIVFCLLWLLYFLVFQKLLNIHL